MGFLAGFVVKNGKSLRKALPLYSFVFLFFSFAKYFIELTFSGLNGFYIKYYVHSLYTPHPIFRMS
jgi:hypothetical protein